MRSTLISIEESKSLVPARLDPVNAPVNVSLFLLIEAMDFDLVQPEATSWDVGENGGR